MNVIEILDTIEELSEKSMRLPLTKGMGTINLDHLTELIGDAKRNLPTEIKQAKGIVTDRSQIIADAKREAEDIVRKAEAQAARFVAADEIYKKAVLEAEELKKTATSGASEMKKAAHDYAGKVLHAADEALTKALSTLRETKTAMGHHHHKV